MTLEIFAVTGGGSVSIPLRFTMAIGAPSTGLKIYINGTLQLVWISLIVLTL